LTRQRDLHTTVSPTSSAGAAWHPCGRAFWRLGKQMYCCKRLTSQSVLDTRLDYKQSKHALQVAGDSSDSPFRFTFATPRTENYRKRTMLLMMPNVGSNLFAYRVSSSRWGHFISPTFETCRISSNCVYMAGAKLDALVAKQ